MAATITITTNTTAKPANRAAEALLSSSALILLVLLAVNTAAFGGAVDGAIFATQVLIVSALALQAALAFLDKAYWEDVGRPARLSLAFFAAFICFGALQSVWTSVYPYATRGATVQLIFYLAYFFVCLKVAAHRRLVGRMAAALAVLAFLATLLGLLQKLSGTDKLYWVRDFGTKTFFGPFVYENNFGAFAGLTFPLILGMAVHRCMSAHREWKEDVRPSPWGLWAGLANNGCLFFVFLSILMPVASFYSEARAPAIMMLGSFLAAFTALAVYKRSMRIVLLAGAGLAGTLILASLMNWGKVPTHYSAEALSSNVGLRLKLITGTLRMFTEKPLAGWGLGTFFTASNRFLQVPTEYLSYAHPNNDYTELLAETGLAGALLVGAGLAAIIVPAIPALFKTESLWAKSMAGQSLLALITLGVMILSDSHLKVPGIAFLFLFQLAVLAGAPRGITAKIQGPASKSRFLTMTVIVGLASLLSFQALIFFHSRLVTGGLDSPEIIQAQIHAEPDNAGHWHLLAFHHYRAGQRKKALESMEKAVELNPLYAHYRFVLGQLQYYYGDKLKGIESIEKSAALAPANRTFGLFLLGVYLVEKEKVVSPTRKQFYEDSVESLYARLMQLPYPPGPLDFEAWMYRYDPQVLNRFKGE